MKKKSASKSAFFNLRVLIGLCIALAGISLALAALDAFGANGVPVKIRNHIITASNDPLVPVGFDCTKIEQLGIDKQENFRAGAIMTACAADSPSGFSSVGGFFQRVGQGVKKLLVPLYGAGDVNLITGTETSPNITQSETFTWANPDNPQQVCVAYNDSRGRNASPINISGISCSTDGGATYTRVTGANGQSPFSGTEGDPVVLYNRANSTWFTVWLDTACGGQGLGGYKSSTPLNAASWTHFCVHNNSQDDRNSGVADNNPSSPFANRMYISWNDFNVGGGALFVTYSSDNGTTWHAPISVNPGFVRDIQITVDKVTGDVYLAAMNENGGNANFTRNNLMYRSTDGGNTWTNTYTGPAFQGAHRTNSGYFACMYNSPAYWRHMGWGQPAAYNHVVGLVYAASNPGNSDPGDVFFIRSTDSGVTFGAPVQLNSNTDPTKAQWMPNLSVSEAGTFFSTWYDETPRTSASCQPSSPTNLCYQMHSNKSPDTGATWLGDQTTSDVASPLPLQPDPGIQGLYVGDYDYGSAILTKHMTSWVDGRNAINGASQQDAYTDRDLVGFAVTTTTPACNSVISTQPVDFVINLTDAVNTATVQANDFTVNAIPANSFTFQNGNTTITFHFNTSPVTTQGPQTMNIPAGAFNRQSDNAPNFAFNCTFCYAITPLMVVNTVPPVGGTFSPPAPNNYNYDVNFNQPVDPASVQDSDLTVSGNSGPSVTGHTLINGNMTVRFTLHMNFGGTLTATLGTGAITANTCNGNASFTGMYNVQGCPPSDHYTISQIGGAIVPGTTDIGNHGDDTVTTIALPFSYTLYDQTFTNINLSSNGNAQFVTTDTAFTNQCLPWTAHNYTILPYWDDLYLVNSGFGIFTSVSGTAPNRIFNIEWRAQYFPGSGSAGFELRLYEGQTRFDVIYGTLTNGNTSATAGVQKNDTAFDQYFCNGAGMPATGAQSYILTPCGSPTPTPTASPSASATATASASATATATATATVPSPTPTGSPSCTPNYIFTVGTGTIVPGTTDTGNHIDDGTTAITLPFPYTDGQSFTAANISSNGNLQFVSNSTLLTNACPLPSATFNMPIMPQWDDLRTDEVGTGCTGAMEEWAAVFSPRYLARHPTASSTSSGGRVDSCANTTRANFELRLYEGQSRFDMVYGEVAQTGSSATVGVQQGTGAQFTQYECNTAGTVNSGLQLVFTQPPCGSPTPTATPTTTASPSCTPGWSAGAPLPVPGVRSVGVYFPANGKFYAMGGRSADTAGSDFMHPFEYDPAANTWTTKAATYPDNQVNNMACGVLTVSGTPFIYCVGGSAAGAATATARVFFYNPVTDTITTLTGADNWPGDAAGTILPGGFAVTGNKLYIVGGFNINVASTNEIWQFDPTAAVGAKWLQRVNAPVPIMYAATAAIGGIIYVGGASDYQGGLVVDTTNSFSFNPATNTTGSITAIPRATGETRALNVNNLMYVMGGGRVAPNPSNEVDVYNPGTNTWSLGTPFVTGRRNFPTDTDGTCRIWLAGGYDRTGVPTASMERFCCGGGASPTPTATPTASPTCTPSSFHVLIAYSDIEGPPATLQSQILAEPGVTGVDLFDASSATPTLAQLQPYNIVVAFSNNPYSDAVAMGNVLADYADTGGVVVGLNFDWFGPPFGLDGRWITGGYTPFNTGPTNFSTSCLGTYDTTHPLMQGISAGSLCAFFRHTLTLSPGAVSVATYQDSQQLCAYKTNNGHTGVGINAYLGENPMDFSGPFGHVIVNAGRWLISGPCGTPSPTPTATATTSGTPSATPTCPPGGSPGPWTQAAPVAIDHYGGFMDSDGTFAYEGGGYSFTTSSTINQFGKFNPATNTWTPLAPVPDLTNAEASGVYAPNVNKLFVFGGDDPTTGIVVNTTRIYDIATNTWSTGAPMPDVRAFMASGYFNGKIYLVGGYSTGNVSPAFLQTWEYDPVANTFVTKTPIPAAVGFGGAGSGVINGHLYVAGGRDANITVIASLWDYDIAADTWTARANLPAPNNVPGSAVIAGKLWIFGGGNPFNGSAASPTFANKGLRAWLKRLFTPDTTNTLQVYDPATNSWTSGPTLNQQRSFPAGTDVGNTAVAVGGYTGSTTTASVEINMAGGGCASPTPTVPPSATPTGSPSCTPGGTPGAWAIASPYPITDVRYGFAQTATHFYVFGGVSNGTRVPDVNRMDIATGMWQSRASMPFSSEAPTCALMPGTNFVYCTEGDTGSGFARYDTVANSWTSLASIPGGDHYGSASGAFNGKVFVAGGTTGFVSAVQVYDVATNTWSAGTSAPNDFLLAGYQQVGQFLYVVGGFEASGPVARASAELSSVLNRSQQSTQPKVPMANNTTTWRLDMSSAPGVWTVGPAFTVGRADFGLAYDAGTNKLYALGGDLPGGGFFDSTNAVDELSVATWPAGTWMPSPPNLISPNRQANQAGFYGAGQIWSVGGIVGQTFQFLAEVQRRSNGSGPCGTPSPTPTFTPTATATATAAFTPTATATATAAFTPTATATATAAFTPTATATATATSTATATATATHTPSATPTATIPSRPSPSPRPRPTPREHAGSNCFASSDCSGLPKSDTLTCIECFAEGGNSWLNGSGCHTTCP